MSTEVCRPKNLKNTVIRWWPITHGKTCVPLANFVFYTHYLHHMFEIGIKSQRRPNKSNMAFCNYAKCPGRAFCKYTRCPGRDEKRLVLGM